MRLTPEQAAALASTPGFSLGDKVRTQGDRTSVKREPFELQAQEYKARARRKSRGERPVQRATLQYLAAHPDVGWVQRMNAGGAYRIPVTELYSFMAMVSPWKAAGGVVQKVKAWLRKFRWVSFAFVGCPDVWFLTKTGRLGVVETKGKNDKLTPQQAEFLDLVVRHGGLACVAYDIGDVENMMNAEEAK